MSAAEIRLTQNGIRPHAGAEGRVSAAAVGLVTAALLIAVLLLVFPVSVPLGPNYWDLPIYLDGAHRIFLGQIPAVDFDAPVGPLGYYLTYLGMRFFPNGHPLFITQWLSLVITLPVMLAVLFSTDARRPLVGIGLTVPFLVYQFLPFNIQAYTTYPAVDAYGIYNRHVCIILYALVTGLIYLRSQVLVATVVFLCVTALFFIKITGFAAAGTLCLFAFAAGRLKFLGALTAAGGFFVILGIVEVLQGSVSAYVDDILTLAALNTETLLPRFLTVASVRFDVIFATMLLIGWLLRTDLAAIRNSVEGGVAAMRSALDRPAFWLAAALFAGIVFETQNTGSQEFVFLWPILLSLLAETFDREDKQSRRIVVALLAAAIALPSLTKVIHRAVRAVVVAPRYLDIKLPQLGVLGNVVTKPDILERIETMGDHYAGHQAAYRDLTARGQLPAWTYYSEIAMQGTWLAELNRAAGKLLDYEKRVGQRFSSVYVTDFTSPLAWALGRDAPKQVQIGLDAFRTMGSLSDETREAIENTDAVLEPLCPVTGGRAEIARLFAPALAGHESVSLDRCWTLYVKR